MSNTDKQLAELVAEEKMLLEQQRNERDALKKRLGCRQETDPGGTAETE